MHNLFIDRFPKSKCSLSTISSQVLHDDPYVRVSKG